jgi:hypothetical protein
VLSLCSFLSHAAAAALNLAAEAAAKKKENENCLKKN